MDAFDVGQGELVHPRERPNLTFEEGSYTLPELLESHLLPVVAQYDSTRQPIPFHEFNFDLSQPLLLYKKRNIQKVVARSLYIEDEKYHEVGESLLVPEDYKGWFAVLQRITGNIKADDTVPHFTTVEEVANSNTDRFLIGGTKKISGLQLLDRSDSQLKHEQRQFLPGDILTREKIYYGETKKRTRLFRKPKYITEKFLMCRDECDREILLPFEQTGIFYQVSHKSGKANKQVMQMSDIVARKLTPRIIKLVFGRFPVTPCSFTGIMRAESSKIETSIITSTLINTKNILMEIPVSSAMYFRVAVMDNSLRTNACYRNAMSICAEKAITYMRNIKVCYNFTMDDDDEGYLSRREFDTTHSQSPSISSFMNNNNNNQTLTTFKQNSGNENLISESLETDTDILRKRLGTEENPNGSLRRGFSVDIPDDITVRPGRCMSTSRVSFCLGNNYLTVPMFDHGRVAKRDSGNNNTIHEMTYTTRRGSRLSFNGMFFEEVEEENEIGDAGEDKDNTPEIPPPIPCTNISSYVNIVSPPQLDADIENTDYIPAAGIRRPSTQPPDTAPPPLPRSSSTSGVSSGSLSSVSDETLSKRASSGSFEYAVPKSQDPNKNVSNLPAVANVSDGNTRPEKPLLRRPSTFTFSEGCFGPAGITPKLPLCQSICDIEETTNEDSCPIYENIQKLMEVVSKMENDRKSGTDDCQTEDDQDSETGNQINDEHCFRETLSSSYDSNENSPTEKVENGVQRVNYFCEGFCDEKCERNADKFRMESGESDADKTKKCDGGENNVVKRKVRRVGVTERKMDILNLSFDSDIETSDLESTENRETNLGCENSDVEIRIEDSAHSDALGENLGYLPKEADNTSEDSPITEKPTNNEQEREDNIDSLCRWRIAVEKMKNSNEIMISRGKIRALEKPISCLGVDEISEELASIGIKECTIGLIREMGVDGAKLSEVLDGDLSIRDCLDGVNLVDQQKISMFLRGWRPNTE